MSLKRTAESRLSDTNWNHGTRDYSRTRGIILYFYRFVLLRRIYRMRSFGEMIYKLRLSITKRISSVKKKKPANLDARSRTQKRAWASVIIFNTDSIIIFHDRFFFKCFRQKRIKVLVFKSWEDAQKSDPSRTHMCSPEGRSAGFSRAVCTAFHV